MDKYKIDSHKLIYHVARVNDWLKGEIVYPIYIEISPSGGCNHRCTYCALDFMEYKSRFLDTNLLKERLSEMAGLGIKSIMYAGEGEPFLHKDIDKIINYTKAAGIDVAITSNGVMFNKAFIESTLSSITWIKISINGAKEETYNKIHRGRQGDFARVIENMSYANKLRKTKGYPCTLGMQLLLLPENYKEAELLAKKARDIGMDYLVIKPYSQHPFSKTTQYKNIKYNQYLELGENLKKYNSKDFNLIFRINTMKKWDTGVRNYKHCLALPFWAYIDAGGGVWACSAYLGDKRFRCGNIYKNTFQEIWNGRKRKQILAMAEKRLDSDKCRVNCRMDEINRYLWELKYPEPHVNFI